MWAGQTVFIVGGGPSVNDADLSVIENHRVIGVNNSYQLGDWVDVCWFGDWKWWTWHREKLKAFSGLVCSCNAKKIFNKIKRVKTLKRSGGRLGINKKPDTVAWNRSSGASAINLAYHFGAARIVLIGFDMRRVDGKKNWHTDHDEKEHSPFKRHLIPFKRIAADAHVLNVEIINATPDSAITCFPITKLEDAI